MIVLLWTDALLWVLVAAVGPGWFFFINGRSCLAVFASLLAVPMNSEQRAIGAMNVQPLEPHDFTADEIELLALIGDLAAGALDKAALYDSMKRQLGELTALARVSEAVTSPIYLDEMLDVWWRWPPK